MLLGVLLICIYFIFFIIVDSRANMSSFKLITSLIATAIASIIIILTLSGKIFED